jgi:hypothetical protein
VKGRWVVLGVSAVVGAGMIAYVAIRRDGLRVTVHNDTQSTLRDVRVGIGASPRWGGPPGSPTEMLTFPTIAANAAEGGRFHFDGEASLVVTFELDGAPCVARGSYVEGAGYEAVVRISACDVWAFETSVWP